MANEDETEPETEPEETPPEPAPDVCGAAYLHLIRTSGGYTYENRCGMFCLMEDVVDWSDAARELMTRINRAWKQLIYVQTGPGDILGCGPGGQPEVCPSEAIQPELRSYFEEVDDMPGWWDLITAGVNTTGETRAWTNRIVANMERGTCLLDRIDRGIVAVGGTPEIIPSKPKEEPASTEPGFWSNLATAAVATTVLIGVGAGIYFIAKNRGAKQIELGD